jgi:hypothetical protein
MRTLSFRYNYRRYAAANSLVLRVLMARSPRMHHHLLCHEDLDFGLDGSGDLFLIHCMYGLPCLWCVVRQW